jgi:hypothetical protein
VTDHFVQGHILVILETLPVTPKSEDEAACLGIQHVKVPNEATGVWQSLDRTIHEAMKPKAHARWASLFARSEIPVATKAFAAGLAKSILG